MEIIEEQVIEQPQEQAPEQQVPQNNVPQEQPTNDDYISKAYNALKQKVGGFSKTPEEFRKLITTDDSYRANVYNAFKQKVQGFSKTQDEFNALIVPRIPQEQKKDDYISLALKAKENEQAQLASQDLEGGQTMLPDIDKREQAARDKQKLKDAGYDSDELATAFQDFPESLFNTKQYNKETLLKLRKDNPIAFQQTIATAKWQAPLYAAIGEKAKALQNPALLEDIANIRNNQISAKPNYDATRKHVQDVVSAIRKYIDDPNEQEKMIGYLAKDAGTSYGVAVQGRDKALENDPRKKYLNKNELLGLQFTEDLDPSAAKTYENVLIDDKKLDNVDGYEVDRGGILGKQQQKAKLATIGINVQMQYASSKMTDYENKIKNGEKPTEKETQDYEDNKAKYEQAQKDLHELSNPNSKEYGKYANYQLDGIAQELFGQRHGFAVNQGLKFQSGMGNAIGSLVYGVEDIFRNPEETKMANLESIGRNIKEKKETYTTQENSLWQNFDIVEKPEFTAAKNKILNDPNLTDEQKIEAGKKLLAENSDGWEMKPIGSRFHPTGKSVGYALADTANGLAQFILANTALGATGLGSRATVLGSTILQGYQRSVANNLENNISQPKAKALLAETITGALFASVDKIGVLKKMFNPSTPIGKAIDEMTEAELEALVKKGGQGFVKNLTEAATGSFKHSLPMTLAGTAGSISHDAINGQLKEAEDYLEEGLTQQALFSILGVAVPAFKKGSENRKIAEFAKEELQNRQPIEVSETAKEEVEGVYGSALKDVESTTKALKEAKYDDNKLPFSLDYLPQDHRAISEAYHKAKSDGTNPELVKAVEDVLAPTQYTEAATPKKEVEGVSGSALKDVEIKNEGISDTPTKESVTERLSINSPFNQKVLDALDKLGLIKKYNSETKEGDLVGGYVQSDGRGGFAAGNMYFKADGSVSYVKGDAIVTFDKNGNVISHNTAEVAASKKRLEIESKKDTIKLFEKTRDSEDFKYKTVNEYDALGNTKKIKRLKTPQELKESTDKINEQIDKAKKELSDLEQQAPTQYTEAATPKKEVVPSDKETIKEETEPDITVSEMLDKTGTYKGEKGSFYQDGQRIIFKVEGKEKEYDLGNVEELKSTPISDMDITHEKSVVSFDDNGDIKVRDTSYKNNYSDPLSAINLDKEGNIVSVNLETADGKKRTFRGNIAEDIAYQLHLKEITKDEKSTAEFEQFINEPEQQATIDNAKVQTTTERSTTTPNAEVPTKEKAAEGTGNGGNTTTTETGKSEAANKPSQETSVETDVDGGGEKPPKSETSENKEDGNETGITHAALNKMREKLGMPKYEGKETETHKQLLETAKELVKGGFDLKSIYDKIKNGEPTTNVENAIMAEYKAALDVELENNPSTETLAKATEFANMWGKAGTALGKGLESLKIVKDLAEANTLSNFLVGRENDKGHKLSDAQIKEETAKFKETKAAEDAYEQALAKEKEADAKLIAEKGLEQARKEKSKAVKKSREEYIAERKSAVEKAKQALAELKKKKGNELTAVPLPFVKSWAEQLTAISPHVKDYVKSLLNEGVDKLEDIATMVHDEFKGVVDGLTKKDVLDIIGGVHDVKKETLNEKAAKLRLLKREAQLLNQLAAARKGEEQAKTETKKSEKTRRIEELENQIKEVRRLNKQKEIDEEGVAESGDVAKISKDQLTQKRLLKEIEKLQNDIKNKNYEKPEPPQKPLKLSRETQALQDKAIALRSKLESDRVADQRAKMSKWEKAWDKFQNVAGVRRLVQTAFDASIWFRQLGALSLNPRKWDVAKKFFTAGGKSVFSEKNYSRIMDGIHKSPDFKETLEDGIRYNELDAVDPKFQNEMFQKSFIMKIPILKDGIRASQRIADASLNVARYELYQKYKNALLKNGITRESDPEMYKEMAKLVMNSTGSGNLLSALENHKAEKLLGATFYGARLMAANFNTLNPLYYAKMPKEVRYEAMKDLAAYTSTMMALGGGLAAMGGKISLNPDDSDFLQIRFGEKVYDITSGKAAYIRTFLRNVEAISARFTKTKYEANKAMEKALQSDVSFFRNKLSPNTGYVVNALTGKSSIGKEFDPYEIAKVYPMYADDMYKAAKEDGFVSLLTVLLPNITGIGYGAYYSEPQKKSIDETIERNTNSDELNKETIKNYKDGGRVVTDKEFQQFADKRDELIKSKIKDLYHKGVLVTDEKTGEPVNKKYDQLTKEQIVKETSRIKSEATKKAKEELFGKEEKDMDKIIQQRALRQARKTQNQEE